MLLAFVLALALARSSALPANELFDDLDFNALSNQFEERTFVSLNSTYIAYGVAAGAVLVLTLAAGLYLYDYFYNPARSDKVNTEPQVDYSQYYSDQEAYNQYLYQQAADNYRYKSILQSTARAQFRNSSIVVVEKFLKTTSLLQALHSHSLAMATYGACSAELVG